MARFTKLKWVPMLIRAYYDAQRQLESRQTNQQSAGTSDSNGGSTSTEIPKKVERNRSRSSPVQNKFPSVRAKRQPKIQPAKIGHKTTRREGATPNMRDRVKLLRELQRTNQKLEELDSIKAQLKEFGITISGFSKEIERLTDHRSPKPQEQTFQRPVLHPQQNSPGVHPNPSPGQPPIDAGPAAW